MPFFKIQEPIISKVLRSYHFRHIKCVYVYIRHKFYLEIVAVGMKLGILKQSVI